MEHKTNKNTNNDINVEIDKNTDRKTNIDKKVILLYKVRVIVITILNVLVFYNLMLETEQ